MMSLSMLCLMNLQHYTHDLVGLADVVRASIVCESVFGDSNEIDFPPQNPLLQSFKSIVLRNDSAADLTFSASLSTPVRSMLTGASLSSSQAAFSVSPSQGVMRAKDEIRLQVQYHPLAAGEHDARINVKILDVPKLAVDALSTDHTLAAAKQPAFFATEVNDEQDATQLTEYSLPAVLVRGECDDYDV